MESWRNLQGPFPLRRDPEPRQATPCPCGTQRFPSCGCVDLGHLLLKSQRCISKMEKYGSRCEKPCRGRYGAVGAVTAGCVSRAGGCLGQMSFPNTPPGPRPYRKSLWGTMIIHQPWDRCSVWGRAEMLRATCRRVFGRAAKGSQTYRRAEHLQTDDFLAALLRWDCLDEKRRCLLASLLTAAINLEHRRLNLFIF